MWLKLASSAVQGGEENRRCVRRSVGGVLVGLGIAIFVVMLSVLMPRPAAAQEATSLTITLEAPADPAQTFVFGEYFFDATFTLRDGGSQEFFFGVPLIQVLPSGWMTESVTCTGSQASLFSSRLNVDGVTYLELPASVTPTGATECTFVTVPAEPTSITLIKAATGAQGETFPVFSGERFSLQTADLSSGQSVTHSVVPGLVTFGEGPSDGWRLSDVLCDSALPPEVNLVTQRNTVAIQPGQQITCTLVNSRVGAATVAIFSVLENDDGRTIGFAIDGQSVEVSSAAPATVSVFPNNGRLLIDQDNSEPDEQFVSVTCTDSFGNELVSSTTSRAHSLSNVAQQAAIECTYVNRIVPTVTYRVAVEGNPGSVPFFPFQRFEGVGNATVHPSFPQTIRIPDNEIVTIGQLDVPNGWEFVSASCQTPTGEQVFDASTFAVSLAAGGDWDCTFTNRPSSDAFVTYRIVAIAPGTTEFTFLDPITGGTTATEGGRSVTVRVPVGEPVTIGQVDTPANYVFTTGYCDTPTGRQLFDTETIDVTFAPDDAWDCAFFNSEIPTPPSTAVQIVTLSGRSDGWVQVGLTRNWVSAVCRSRLVAAGAVVRNVSWPTLAVLADAVPFQRCDALLADLFPTEARILTLAGRTDGWVQIGGTRNWVSSACRAELVAAGTTVHRVAWSTLSELVDATPFQRCDALTQELFPVRVVTLAGRTDGWVQVGSTRNWVGTTCRAALVKRGLAVQEVPWTTLDGLVDAAPFRRCDAIVNSLFG